MEKAELASNHVASVSTCELTRAWCVTDSENRFAFGGRIYSGVQVLLNHDSGVAEGAGVAEGGRGVSVGGAPDSVKSTSNAS